MQVQGVEPDARTRVSPRLLGITALLGIAFDLAVNGQLPGAGSALFFLLSAVALRASFAPGLERDLLLAGAAIFGGFTAVRASPDLNVLNVLAASGLLGLAATGDGVLRARVEGFLRRGAHLPMSAIHVPAALLGPLAHAAGRIGTVRARAIGRAILIVAPILALFAALLASADQVFGELLLLPGLPELDLAGATSHVALTVLGMLLVGTLWMSARRALPPPFADASSVMPKVRSGEWITVLAGIDLLFAIFVGVQFAFLFGGQRSIEITDGLTYAEYARGGFFQLLAVAGLTAIVILGGWDLGQRSDPKHERLFRGLVTIMVAFSGVILASAVMRLTLYQGEFGWTIARLAGYAAITWIAIVLVILLGAIWAGARDRVIALALIAGLVTLLGLNILDPERFVAERNVARFEDIGKLDVDYLGTGLGLDAVAVSIEVLDSLPRAQAERLRASLCERAERLAGAAGGWRSANLARANARNALAGTGITAQACTSR